MIIDRLKSLAIFAEIVRQGSFRGAARSMKLTPSAVSYHLKTLEDAAGCPLLYRSTRSFSLTSAGETLYRSALEMLGAAEAGFHDITEGDLKLKGQLRIALTSAMAHSFLSERISRFLANHPDVSVLLHYDNELNNLISDSFDLALRTGKMVDSSLKCRLIWSMPRTLVASPDYLANTFIPHHADDLTKLRWIKFENLDEERTILSAENTPHKVKQSGRLTVNNIEAMVDMTLNGSGISSPPAHYVEELIAQKRLVKLLPEWRIEDIPVYAIWPASKVENPITRAFLNLISTEPAPGYA